MRNVTFNKKDYLNGITFNINVSVPAKWCIFPYIMSLLVNHYFAFVSTLISLTQIKVITIEVNVRNKYASTTNVFSLKNSEVFKTGHQIIFKQIWLKLIFQNLRIIQLCVFPVYKDFDLLCLIMWRSVIKQTSNFFVDWNIDSKLGSWPLE